MDFDGVNDWVDLRAGGAVLDFINGASGTSLLGWFDLDATTDEHLIGLSINNGGVPIADSRAELQLTPGGVLGYNFRIGDGDALETGDDGGGNVGTALAHFAITADGPGDTVRLYRNGLLTATNAVTFAGAAFTGTGCASAALMAQDDGLTLFADGRATDLRVYNRVLSDAEIATIYQSRGHDNIVSGLVAKYQLTEAPPTVTLQQSPQIASITNTASATDGTTHNVSMPATVNKSDLLLVFIVVEGDNTATFTPTPTGWTPLFSSGAGTTNLTGGFAKIADGTEGGTTVDFATSNTGGFAAHTYRITDWYGTLAGVTTGTTATSAGTTTPNPPNNAPTWGTTVQQTLWIAVVGSTDDDETATTAPAGFGGLTSTIVGGGANDGGAMSSANVVSAVASNNPGTFTLTGSEATVAQTISIRPQQVVKDSSISTRHGTANGGVVGFENTAISKRRRYH